MSGAAACLLMRAAASTQLLPFDRALELEGNIENHDFICREHGFEHWQDSLR
jgi:hypothetical protein